MCHLSDGCVMRSFFRRTSSRALQKKKPEHGLQEFVLNVQATISECRNPLPACRSRRKSSSFLTCAKAVTNLFIDSGEILGVSVARTSSVPYRRNQHRRS